MNLDWAVQLLEHYGLIGLFVVVMLEYACLPMPSEVLLPLSGLATAAAGIPLALVVAVSVLAGLCGSSICYALGAFGGRPLLNKLLHKFPKALKSLDAAEAWQKENGGPSIVTARMIPICRTWISFAAGMALQPYWAFTLYSSMGIIVWNTLLIGSGYYLYISGVAIQSNGITWLLPVIGVLVGLLSFFIRKFVKKRIQKTA